MEEPQSELREQSGPQPESQDRPPKPTQQQVEEADDLLKRAHLAKIRGNKREAEELVEKAAAVAPGSAQVLAASAEFLVERRQFRKARDLYAKAVAVAPEDKAIANRHAELVLATSAFADPDSLLKQTEKTESVASAKASALLSFIIPGLGQVVAGEAAKGLVMFGIWASALLLFFFLPGVASGFAAFVMPSDQPPNLLGGMFLAIALITWVTAIADRNAAAKHHTPKQVHRPDVPEEGRGYDFE